MAVLCSVTTTSTSAAANYAGNANKGNLRKLQSGEQTPIGFQSGPDPGPSYGGSIVFRPDTNRIYITGSTYGNYFKSNNGDDVNTITTSGQSSCFLGIAELPGTGKDDGSMKWVHSKQWESSVPEACNVIQVDNNPNNLPENNTDIQEKLYLLGYTATNGIMEPLRMESTFPADQYGMIMDVDIVDQPIGNSPISTTFWGGRILQDGPVQYPIDMTIDNEGNLYVVSLQTYDSKPSTTTRSPNQMAKQMVSPLETPLGDEYNMLVEQFLYDNPGYDDGKGIPADSANVPLDTTIVDNWRKPYGPTNGSGGVIVSGVMHLGGLLVIVGSTAGHSPVFGNDITTNSDDPDKSVKGFITKLIPESGSYYQFVVDNGAPESEREKQPAHKRSATSIMSFDAKDDFIMGMCSSQTDPDNFYIVGTTEGQMDKGMNMLVKGEIHAFLTKVNLWTLLPVWTKQIGGNPLTKDVVRGMACAVTADGKDVYLAGVVENGGSLSLYDQESKGKDDIFILQTSADDGALRFLRQIGTSGNDRLSSGGLTTDELGNAILMGNTDGSFFRSRQFDQETEESDDIFIMTVTRNTGNYKEPELEPEAAATPVITDTAAERPISEVPVVTNPPTQPAPVQTEPPVKETEAPEPFKPIGEQPEVFTNTGSVTTDDFENMHNQIEKEQEALEERDNAVTTSKEQRYGLLIFFVLIALVSVGAGVFAVKQISRGDRATDRDNVTSYLRDFDDDDIDLKKSATGGYHCSYTNDLAHGLNARCASRGEGLFGFYGDDAVNDPLLAVPPRSGEITFSNDRDDVSSIGSGIGSGRHSTHNPLMDDYDGQVTKDLLL